MSTNRLLASSASNSGFIAPQRCRFLVVGLSLAMTLLSGCATGPFEYVKNGFKVGPNYRKPTTAVSEHWIDYQDGRIVSTPPNDAAWWQVFGDPVLNDLTRRAYAQNLTLRQAGLRVLESRAIRAARVGELFPQTQTLNGFLQTNQLSIGSLSSSGIGGIGGGIDRNFGVYRFGSQLAWELDFWGRFRRSIEAADAELDASVENYDDVLVILLADVAASYVEIRTLEQRLRYARSNVKYQRGSYDLAEAKRAEGVASRLDTAQALTNVAQTEAIIPQLEVQLRAAQNRLCVLMGFPPQDLTPLLSGVESRIPKAPVSVALGVPADLIRRRPDVRRAEREAAAASARIGVIESAMYPAFSINGTIFVQTTNFSNLFTNPAQGGNFGPSFNWNVLNYGRIRNAARAEEARFYQLVTQYQSVVLDANRQAENGIVAFLNFQEQARILREGAAAAEMSRDLVTELYQGGRADFGRVFFAEYFLVQQQDSLAQAEGAIAQALVELYRSLGGGWQIRLGGTTANANPAGPVPAAPPVPGEPVPAVPVPVDAVRGEQTLLQVPVLDTTNGQPVESALRPSVEQQR